MVKTLSGVTNFTVSDTLKVKKVSANDSLGTAGQVLTTNGAATYWATPTAEAVINTAAQYVWTNTNIFNANVTVNAALIANGSPGTAGHVLHSNGTAVYWAVDDFNVNTTYDLLAVANTEANKGIIRLKDVNDANDDVYVTGAGGVVVSSNASHILITGQSGDITGVSAGDGLTGTTTSGEALISVLANTGIIANTTGTYVNAAYIATIASNSSNFANLATYVSTATTTNTFNVGTSTYFLANGNVGIGNSSPSAPFTIQKAGSASTIITKFVTEITGTAGSLFDYEHYNSVDGNGSAQIRFNKANGTVAAPTIVGTDRATGRFGSRGYDGTAFYDNALIRMAVDGAPETGSMPGRLEFWTTPSGSTTLVERMRITSTGNVGISNTAPADKFSVNGTSYFGANVTLTAALIANSSAGSAGQVLHSNGTATYWSADDNTNTTYDLLTVANTEANKAIIRLQDSGNANDDVFIIGANGITTTSNSSGAYAYAVGSSTVTVNTSGIHVNPDLTIANLTASYANVTNDLYVGRNVAIQGNLTIYGTATSLQGNTITFSDNMLYLNQGVLATITGVSGNGTYVTFTANNNYQTGWDVVVTGVNPTSYNGTYQNIFSANATHFQVANTNTASYVSGGTARGKSDQNPDLGIAAGYNDGTYHHTGLFRDATDGYWKVFDGYLPEPDANINIDTSNNSFNVAGFWSGNTRVGNTTVYTSISNFGINFAASGYEVNPTGARFGFYNGGGTPQTYMQMPAGGEIVFWNSGTGEVMRIANNNKVGIGTNNPSTILSVIDNSGIDTQISAYGATNKKAYFRTNSGFGVNQTFGTDAIGGFMYVETDHPFYISTGSSHIYFSTNRAERMRIASDGNVGIGTTSPSQKLSVAGNALIGTESSTRLTLIGAGGPQAVREYYDAEVNPRWAIGRDFISSGQAGIGFVSVANGAFANVGVAMGTPGTSTLALYTSNGTALTERMRVTSAGNVGIGTTTPLTRLDINDGYVRFADGWGLIWGAVANPPYISGSNTDDTLTFGNAGSERMRIDSAGNVGIGRTNPSYKLDVAGSTRVAGYLIGVDGTDAIKYLFTSDGGNSYISSNLGIGTSTPSYILDIAKGDSPTLRLYSTYTESSVTTATAILHGNRTAAGGPVTELRFVNTDGAVSVAETGKASIKSWRSGAGLLDIAFETNNTERMRLDSSGRLLLGLTSAAADSAAIISGTNFSGRALTLTGSAINSGTAGQVSLTLAHFGDGSNPEVGSVIRSIEEGNNTLAGSLTFEVFGASARSEAMRINSSGNVGIGTNAPNGKLAVVGTIVGNNFSTQWADTTGAATNIPLTTQGGGYSYLSVDNASNVPNNASLIRLGNIYTGTNNRSASWIGSFYNYNYSSSLAFYSGKKGDNALLPYQSALNAILEQNAISFYTGAAGTSDTTERVRIDSAGNFGIGTTAPAQKLHVYNNTSIVMARVEAVNAGSAYLNLKTDNRSYNIFTENSTSGLVFYDVSQGSERIRLAPNGNVGIGTSSPVGKLSVVGDILAPSFNTDTTYTIGIQDAPTNVYGITKRGSLKIQASSAIVGADSMGGGDLTLKAGDSYSATTNIDGNINIIAGYNLASSSLSRGAVIFKTNNTERMYVAVDGNVGIGTTAPSAKLDVANGDIRLANNATYIRSVTTGGNSVRMLGINGSDIAYVGAIDSGPIGTIFNASSTSNYIAMYTAGAERIRILSNGDIGIGQSTVTGVFGRTVSATGPNGATYRVAGATVSGYMYASDGLGYAGITTETNHPLVIGTNGTERMRITAAGLVGIGITAPNRALTIGNSGVIGLYDTGNANQATLQMAASGFEQYVGASKYIAFGTDATERMRITAVGDVGIGTTSPLNYSGYTSLTIGSTNSVGLIKLRSSYNSGNGAEIYQTTGGATYFTTNSASTWMLSDSVGNVGIGTTSPTSRLNVSGGQIRIQTSGTYSEPAVIAGILAFDSVGGQLTISSRSNGGSTYTSFFTSDSGTGAERMRITGAGNVGIGTSSPTGTFDVQNNTGSLSATRDVTAEFHRADGTYAPRFQIRHSTAGTDLHHTYGSSAPNLTLSIADTECMRLTQSGNIGIGNISPAGKLSVYTTSLNSDTDYNGQNFGLIIGKDNGENVNDDGNGIVFTQQYATDAVDSSQVRTGAIIGYKGQGVGSFGGGLKFKVQPAGANPMSTVMTLTKEGNVGIGTTTPAAKLDVNGEIRALSISGYNLSNNAATIDTGLTPADFTILEAFGSANPNSDGSANYRDPIHLYIYRGTGWNGSAMTEYVYAQSIAPPARSAFPSGGAAANENMSVVWVKAGVESDTCPLNDATYSLRIKISNYTTTSYFNLRIVRRF